MSSQAPNPNFKDEDQEQVEEYYYTQIHKLQAKYEEMGKGQEFRTEWARMLSAGKTVDSIWFALAFKMHIYAMQGENYGHYETGHAAEEKEVSEQQQDEAAKTECSDECECSKDPKECPPLCNDDGHHVPEAECTDECECPKECPPPCNDECECPK